MSERPLSAQRNFTTSNLLPDYIEQWHLAHRGRFARWHLLRGLCYCRSRPDRPDSTGTQRLHRGEGVTALSHLGFAITIDCF